MPSFNFSVLIKIFCALLLLWSADLFAASRTRVFGNYIFDDGAIIKMSGLEQNPKLSDLDVRQRLETSNAFSRVRVTRDAETITIVVREKTPGFFLPYLFSDSSSVVYGVAGGMSGIGSEDTSIAGRLQRGKDSRAASVMYRNEYAFNSFWATGFSFDHENALHDIFSGRSSVKRLRNKFSAYNFQVGYHTTPNLMLEFDTHIESHSFEEESGRSAGGLHMSHRAWLEYGAFFLNEGMARGHAIRPYIEFTNPWSDYKFVQAGIFLKSSVFRTGNFNWIARPKIEFGNPLPRYQLFEVGGSKLRSFSSQQFRANAYFSAQNDFLLSAWDFWGVKLRSLAYIDWAYIEKGGRTGIGGGLQLFFPHVSIPGIQIYSGYGFHPNGFAVIAAIGPQL